VTYSAHPTLVHTRATFYMSVLFSIHTNTWFGRNWPVNRQTRGCH